LPQTEASAEKRKIAITTIAREQPKVAWKLLISLLPKRHQSSMRTYRPLFKNTNSERLDKTINQVEYWQQIACYSELARSLMKDDIARLTEFASTLHRLPNDQTTAFIDTLESISLSIKPTGETAKLWKTLKVLAAKMEKTELSKNDKLRLAKILSAIEPINPSYQYQQLFGHNDPEFYSPDDDDWNEKAKKQAVRRRNAIKELLEFGGANAIRDFIELADEAVFVGCSLGALPDHSFDSEFLPKELMSDNPRIQQFIYGYVRETFRRKRWPWLGQLDLGSWSRIEIGKLLALLPFSSETWDKATELLGDLAVEYWTLVNPNPVEAINDLPTATAKLIENDQPLLALACMNIGIHVKQPFNVKQAEQALCLLLKNKELHGAADRHDVMNVIKALQQAPDADTETVAMIEWHFLPLLDNDYQGSPLLLEHTLARKPEFFCNVVSLCYRSDNEQKNKRRELTEEEKTIAQNAWTLLYNWRIPPGTQRDNSFSPTHFEEWNAKVKKITSDLGYLSVASILIGRVLFYSQADPDGLWIHKTVAAALNERDAEEIRSGYIEQAFNSRGAHWVDPEAKEEKELASLYNHKAESVENAGYHRFAVSLRQLAQSYETEAENIIKNADSGGYEDD